MTKASHRAFQGNPNGGNNGVKIRPFRGNHNKKFVAHSTGLCSLFLIHFIWNFTKDYYFYNPER